MPEGSVELGGLGNGSFRKSEHVLDPSYFHRLFTRMFGLTPAQRVLGCRIAAARVALMNRELGLTEVAQRCGFSSQSYFSTCFKRVVGKSPLAYREEKLDSSKK